jgi:PTH1 family peptidyl-tRNA hydrolase
MSIAVIAGLGNPGSRYAATRHNIGFIVADALAHRWAAAWKREPACNALQANAVNRPILLKPQGFMNTSGEVIAAFARYYQIPAESILVIYDDITLEPARLRLTRQGSDGGHNGIADLLRHLGDGFARFRIGIGSKPHPAMDLKDHVLGRFTPDEQSLHQQALPHYLSGLENVVEHGVDKAMNFINRRNKPTSDEPNNQPT